MKLTKALIFILLKILEIAILPVVYFPSCFVGYLLEKDVEPWYYINYFMLGFLCILLSTIIIWAIFLIITHIIPDWINANKKLTDKIYNKLWKQTQ